MLQKETFEMLAGMDDDYQKIADRLNESQLEFLKEKGKTYIRNTVRETNYQIYIASDGALVCSCPAWKFSKPIRNFCKHCAYAMLKELDVENRQETSSEKK